MLRDDLQDGAVSTAKAYAHAQVERRHVLFAIAKRFRANPSIGPHFDAARAALEPRGSANGLPTIGPEAAALLESIHYEQQALAAFSSSIGGGKTGTDDAEGQVQQSAAATAQAVSAPEPSKGENLADILKELEGLVGLAPVKEQVKRVLAVVQANAEREKAGLAAVNPSLHLVFTGPPGTGKTTVARLVARLYAAAGALPGARFNEASRADLVAGYIGQTAIKTAELIQRSRPGVLFIDEAYALAQNVGRDFGEEAIATLVKAMEDHRKEFAVIVAGYENEMANFIASNPGLRSRFKTYIAFSDYSPAELLLMFERLAADSRIELGPGVRERAEVVLNEAVGYMDFGNARFMRSMFEQAYARMAARAAMDGTVEVHEVTAFAPDDIVLDIDHLRREQRKIGFQSQ